MLGQSWDLYPDYVVLHLSWEMCQDWDFQDPDHAGPDLDSVMAGCSSLDQNENPE